MDLLKYINGVLFIDDKRDDVEQLYQYFEKFNVPCMYINPIEYNGDVNNSIGFARFVFLDLEYLPGTLNLTDVVSLLRDLSEKGMKNIVLIMWTLHDDHIEEFKKLLDEKMKRDKPILIFNANKEEYVELSQEEYTSKLNKLFQDSIEEHPLIFKMLEWEKSANVATYKTFNDILAFSYNETDKNFNLSLVLSNMASQNIPSDKISSALDVANNMLTDRIKYETDNIEDIVLEKREDTDLLRKLNYNLIFVNSGIKQLSPGNIYGSHSLSLRIKEVIDNIDVPDLAGKCNSILIDMTPACSFAHSNNLILLNGIIAKNITESERKKLKKAFESHVFLKDVYIDDEGQLSYLIIDCFGISTAKKEEIVNDPITCLKESYRLNLQQQFGNYLGRIGDNVYHK